MLFATVFKINYLVYVYCLTYIVMLPSSNVDVFFQKTESVRIDTTDQNAMYIRMVGK